MNVSYLENQVMNMIPNLRDPVDINFALNRVIDMINSRIHGIRDTLLAVSLGPVGPSTGFSWSSSQLRLTMPKTVKKVFIVYMIIGTTKYFYKSKNIETVENNPSDDIFWQPGRDQLEFAKENSNLQGSSGYLYITCLRTFDRVAVDSTTIDLPESWVAGVISGIISVLTNKKKFENESLSKESKADFGVLLEGINKWESNRVPIPEFKPEYNYAEPGKY